MSGIDITCPHCSRRFRIAASQVPQRTFQARCGSCAQIFPIDGKELLTARPRPKTPPLPAFLCLDSGEELSATLQEIQGASLLLTPSQPLSKEYRQTLSQKKCVLRLGLHEEESCWEYFITFSCAAVHPQGDSVRVELATLPGQNWLVVEEHGVYIFVVRSGGLLEDGWKPLKKNQIPTESPIPRSAGDNKGPMILCGKMEKNLGRLQFKFYPLIDLLAIQRIAKDRKLLHEGEDKTLPFPDEARTPSARSANFSGSPSSVRVNETIVRSFGQTTESYDISPDGAEWLTNVVQPPLSPRQEITPRKAAPQPEPYDDEDITVKEKFTQKNTIPENIPAPDDDYTARDDLAPPRRPTAQQNGIAKSRWMTGRLPEKDHR